MSYLLQLVRNEPVALIALADALISAAVVFGAPINDQQKAAIVAVLTILAGVLARAQVTPTATLGVVTPKP